jgi:2-methylisocitrate lyase-like PEP mutase family enzyme
MQTEPTKSGAKMNTQDVVQKATRLRELHEGERPLVVPNAFDAASARVLANAGFPTIATSSAAMAWAAGAADGETLSFEDALEQHTRAVRAVGVPVSIDFEGGYVEGSGGVANTVVAVIEAGVSGLNLEDTDFSSPQAAVVDAERHAERIGEARAAAEGEGVPLFLIGRTDLFFRGIGEPEGRAEEAARRLALYAEAGADCAFAPGIADEADIEALVGAIDVPLNVMHTADTPSLERLAELGVGRLTFGVGFYLAALAMVERAALGLRDGELGGLAVGRDLSEDALAAVAG